MESVRVDGKPLREAGPVRPTPGQVLDQVGQLDRQVAAARVLEVDDADPRAVPEVVLQVRIAVRDDRIRT